MSNETPGPAGSQPSSPNQPTTSGQFDSRFENGLPEDADDPMRAEFIKHCIKNYQQMDWHGTTLSGYFSDDFASFDEGMFTRVASNDRRILRDLLRKRGVYVRKGRGVSISDALYELVIEHKPWPENEDASECIQDPVRDNQGDNHQQRDSQRNADTGGNDVTTTQSGTPETATYNIRDQRKGSDAPSSNRTNISNLSKVYYGDGDRYSGIPTDNFDRKLCLFNERCAQSGVPVNEKYRAFSIMLTGRARDFYFDNLQGKELAFDDMVTMVKRRFITAEHERTLVREWDSLSLRGVMSENVGKSKKYCLKELVSRMHALQCGLPDAYCKDKIFKNKLLNAVKDIETCRLAYFKPAETVEGLISDLHSSLAIEPHSPQDAVLNAHFIDRRYKGTRNRKPPRTCIVCKKSGCWSTNHSAAGRINAFKKNKPLRQFMAQIEKDESTNDEEQEELADQLEDVFVHLLEVEGEEEDEATPSGFIARIESDDNITSFVAKLHDCTVSHALSTDIIQPQSYTNEFFYGVMVDTGCSRASTGVLKQYQAYCRHVGQGEMIDVTRQAHCQFGIGGATSKGMARIDFPMNKLVLSFFIHVIDADVPILLSLADMDRLKIFFNNIKNKLNHVDSGENIDVSRHFGHPFIEWNPAQNCFFTELELRRLHKRFGHPNSDKLFNLLKKAYFENVNSDTRKILQNITRRCNPCQTYAQGPRRFKFTLRDDKEFNHTVFVDIFYIKKKPILHVVDESTRYQAARWLPNVSAETVWKAMRLCWIDVYLGAPDFITHDAGKKFIARVFQSNAELLHIKTKAVPIESLNSMSFVERYHSPIRRAFNIIKTEAPDLTDEEALQTAVKSVNDSVGPDGLVPTLLVYGALPRLVLPTDKPTPSTFQRAFALRKATEEMSKQFARKQVSAAVRERNGPDTTDIHSAPIDSHVLVYRPEKDKWDVPFTILDIQGETCTVLLPPPSGPSKFRTTVVKRYLVDEVIGDVTSEHENVINQPPVTPTSALMTEIICDEHVKSFAARVNRQSTDDKRFADARRKKVDGLMNRGVFTIAKRSDAHGLRIYGSRFVDTIKNEGTPEAFEKSRLVVQGFNDNHGLLTHAPTVQRASQRLLLALIACRPDLTLITCDVSQAFVQSDTDIKRPISVKPPNILGYSQDTLFLVNRPLYGISEAEIHWFFTYHRYHKEKLGMHPSIYDPCFLYIKNSMPIMLEKESLPRGFVCLQTDDTAYAGNKAFIELEEQAKKSFDSKESTILHDGEKLKLNGSTVMLDRNVYSISQPDYVKKLRKLDEKSFTKYQFVSERARGSYVAAVCRPESSFNFCVASQITEPEVKDVKALNKAIEACTMD